MSAARRVNADAGFSLIEMLLVLAILALAATLVVPRLSTGLPGARMEHSVRLIASELVELRAIAIRENRAQSLALDAIRLPEGVHATLEPGVIRFLPDGRSSGGRITLSEGTHAARVEIDWLTGIVRAEVQR